MERTVRTAVGKEIAYEHKCGIKVWDSDKLLEHNKKVVAHEAPEIPILFMPTLTDILLGFNFLNKYILGIDYDRKVFWLDKM